MQHVDTRTERDDDKSLSQTVKAQIALRELILSGELKPGDRISELAMVARLGVSRTPVRAAIVRLEQEGLLEAIPSGGYAVKFFTEAEIVDSIAIRGTLEGMAARFAAERGASQALLDEISECVDQLDALVSGPDFPDDVFSQYVTFNEKFHALIVEMAQSPPLARQIEKVVALPFASPSGFVNVGSARPELLAILTIAQEHHRAVVDAIRNREGARAEALMREHSRLAYRHMQLALRNQNTFQLVPGAGLIRRRRP